MQAIKPAVVDFSLRSDYKPTTFTLSERHKQTHRSEGVADVIEHDGGVQNTPATGDYFQCCKTIFQHAAKSADRACLNRNFAAQAKSEGVDEKLTTTIRITDFSDIHAMGFAGSQKVEGRLPVARDSASGSVIIA